MVLHFEPYPVVLWPKKGQFRGKRASRRLHLKESRIRSGQVRMSSGGTSELAYEEGSCRESLHSGVSVLEGKMVHVFFFGFQGTPKAKPFWRP